MIEVLDRSDKFNWDLEDIEIKELEPKLEKGMEVLTNVLLNQKKRATKDAEPAT